MIDTLFIEKRVLENRYTERILSRIKYKRREEIDRISDIFERVKKPYLHKRTNLNAFIGVKEGKLLKDAGDTYGLGGVKHYYFSHAYNCIYECHYCYLQGYFNSPDLVFFVNHEDFIDGMKKVLDEHSPNEVYFHGGEFSDSLALSNITQEWDIYWDFFKNNNKAILELRTKSAQVKPLFHLEPLPNTIISFTLSPKEGIESYEDKTPSLEGRLRAIEKLIDKNFMIAIHLDPIIDRGKDLKDYKELIDILFDRIPKEKIKYISTGVIRFSKESFLEVSKNYPESILNHENFESRKDGKKSYSDVKRYLVLKKIVDFILSKGYNRERVYLCMEK